MPPTSKRSPHAGSPSQTMSIGHTSHTHALALAFVLVKLGPAVSDSGLSYMVDRTTVSDPHRRLLILKAQKEFVSPHVRQCMEQRADDGTPRIELGRIPFVSTWRASPWADARSNRLVEVLEGRRSLRAGNVATAPVSDDYVARKNPHPGNEIRGITWPWCPWLGEMSPSIRQCLLQRGRALYDVARSRSREVVVLVPTLPGTDRHRARDQR